MPEYEVNINGKPKKIELTRKGDSIYEAKIDGKTCKFSIPKNAVSLGRPLTVEMDDKTYQIEFSKRSQTREFSVVVDKITFKAEVRTPNRNTLMKTFEPVITGVGRRAASNKQVLEGGINSPMTGKLVSLKVNKGDNVQKGQVLCVIEAMKMENEISAPKAGVIKEVLVSVGSPVNEGDMLIVIG